MVDDCLVCRANRGSIDLPGGPLLANESVIAYHGPPLPKKPLPYLGWVLVTPRRHVAGWADLTPEAAGAMGVAISRLSRALEAVGAQRVYLAVVGHGTPSLHVHLLPRYPDTPDDIEWYRVDQWPGARRGGAGEVAEMAAQIRQEL